MGLLNIVGSLVGGVLGNKASSDAADKANKANEEINKRNLQFAANATKIRTDDMRRAGINPILAANPGAAASAPQQIAAQKADVGSVVSSAASVGNMFTQSQQKDIAKERLALDTANSALNVNKVAQEIENLKTTNAATAAGTRLADSQALTQETMRQANLASAGLSSAKTAESRINAAEMQMRLQHIQNQGYAPWLAGQDIKSLGGGKTGFWSGLATSLGGAIIEHARGGSASSAKKQSVPFPDRGLTMSRKGTNFNPDHNYRR